MAYIAAHHSGRWEVRESHMTPAGPRSRTLATFAVLTPEVIARARERAAKPPTPAELRAAASRVGAPVAADAPDRAAGELLAEIAAGRAPRPLLRRLLLDVLQDREGSSENMQAAAAWISASAQQRGEALRDLLLLADRLPPRRASARPRPHFPRIESAPA